MHRPGHEMLSWARSFQGGKAAWRPLPFTLPLSLRVRTVGFQQASRVSSAWQSFEGFLDAAVLTLRQQDGCKPPISAFCCASACADEELGILLDWTPGQSCVPHLFAGCFGMQEAFKWARKVSMGFIAW